MAGDSDHLTRFLLPHAGVRGVHVHLGDAWRKIAERNDHGAAVDELLAEACVAAALLTGHAKVEGRLSIQLRSGGPLRTLFAECTAAGTLRGIARVADGDRTVSRDLRALGDDALLAVTIENPAPGDREPARYQGLVPIERDTLAGALEDYFERSEQLPTRLLLACSTGAAAGLMLQKLPADRGDPDGWNRASILLDTATGDELLERPAADLLHRLFHLEAVEVVAGHALAFGCSCSRERVAAMFESLGQEEARLALVDGQAEVICEFCGQRYLFDAAELDAVFTGGGLQSRGSDALH